MVLEVEVPLESVEELLEPDLDLDFELDLELFFLSLSGSRPVASPFPNQVFLSVKKMFCHVSVGRVEEESMQFIGIFIAVELNVIRQIISCDFDILQVSIVVSSLLNVGGVPVDFTTGPFNGTETVRLAPLGHNEQLNTRWSLRIIIITSSFIL